MRIILKLDDRIARDLKRIAQRSGEAFEVVVNETLAAGLAAQGERAKPRRYRLRTVSLGGLREGMNLDKALALADSLVDDELVSRMEVQK